MNSTANKSEGRWFQLSLRTLLILLTVLCVWLGFKVRTASRQKRAVQAIKAIRADISSPSIEYDFQFDFNSQPIPGAEAPWPAWLRDALGEDLFIKAIGVSLDGTQAGDDDLIHLNDIPDLKRLDLEWTSVTDAGLKSLTEYQNLERLDLQETQVSDAGLRHVAELTQLRILLLGNISGNSGISDAGLTHLKGLTRLQHLGLRYTRVQGDGLKQLAGLTKLETLDLDGTPVDDSALLYLSHLTSLTELDLLDTNVTAEGVASLQKSLPNCTIKFDQAKGDSFFGP